MPEDETNAVRAVYDITAESYAGAIGTRLNPAFEAPIDRALLAAFVESLQGGERPVADLGCGPGRVAAFLAERGLTPLGLDLSSTMLAIARRTHTALSVCAGDLLALPWATGSLDGAVCWYSIIHTSPGELPALFREVRRVVTPDSPLLLAFQTGHDELLHREDAHGSGRPLINFRHSVRTVVDALAEANLDVLSRTVREPLLSGESTPQAFVFARSRAAARTTAAPAEQAGGARPTIAAVATSSDVDAYIERSHRWPDEMAELRATLLSCGLDEQIKWGKPCYSHEGRNIVILQEMKDFLALMFFKGALLSDPRGVLEEQGPNSRAARRICFTSVADVTRSADTVRAYVHEAIDVERSGQELPPAPELVLVEELQLRLDRDPVLEEAFEALTPGRQREYNLYFSGAKQAKTRAARVEKYVPRILDGRGLRDG